MNLNFETMTAIALAILGSAGFFWALRSWAWSEGDHETDEQQTSHGRSFVAGISMICASAVLAAGLWG